jgi:hypothetical protein
MNTPPASGSSRRHFLRAAGVALALPMLDHFLPRGYAAAATAGAAPVRRMVCMNTTLGIYADNLFPKATGRDFELTPYLQVLKGVRDQMTVFSGVSHPGVDGGHASEQCFLTAAPHPGGNSFRNTISLDQYVLEKQPPTTRVRSLTLSTAEAGNSISYNRGGVMLPADHKPSAVFKRLFVEGTPEQKKVQVARLKEGQSIMDQMLDRTKQLQNRVGSSDRARLDQYFTSVREVEQRMVKAQEWVNTPKPKVNAREPVDVAGEADVLGRTRLLFDLVHLALQTDSTRVATVALWGHGAVLPIPGVDEGWHNLSHHGKDPHKIAELNIIEAAQFQCLAELLMKMKATPDQGGTLLDHSMVLYGSNLGNAASHDTTNLPLLLFGGGFRHAGHLAFNRADNQPLASLYVSMLQRLGIEVDEFVSGKGRINGLELA